MPFLALAIAALFLVPALKAQQPPVGVSASISQSSVNEGGGFTVTVQANAPRAFAYNVYLGFDLYDAAGHTGPNDLDGAVVAWVQMPANSNTVVLNLTARADGLFEGNESFEVFVQPEPGEPQNYRPIGVTNTVSIVDLDPVPQAYFDRTTNSVVEGSPGFGIGVRFDVRLSPRSQAPVRVNWSFAPAALNTATPGSDFAYLTSIFPLPADGSMYFAGGVGTNRYEIVVNGDALNETDETIVLQLSLPAGGPFSPVTLRPGFSTNAITILNDDPLPTVRFLQATSSAPGNEVPRSVEVRLNAPAGRTNSVNWAVTGGTATAGLDFTGPTAGTLVFPPGVTNQAIPIQVVNDLATEPDETVILTLSGPVNATLGSPNIHTNIIRDDDVNISWGVPHRQTNVVEGSSGPNRFSLPVTLSRVMSQDVTVEVTERTVVPGVDYTRISPQRLTIPAGQTQTTFVIDINGDTTDELDENVFFNLTLPNIGTVIGGSEFQVTIVDDDLPAVDVTFGVPSVTLTEATTTVFVDVYLSDAVDRPVWVTFTTNGTATPAQDYTLFGANPRLVAFSPLQVAQQIRIDLLNDSVWEGQETLTLRFDGFNGTAPGLITNFTLRINDSLPAPTAGFGNFSTSFQEAITSPSVPVQLSAPTAIPVKVNVAVTGGTATGGGVDYSLNSGTVYFEAGETQKNVAVTCINDALDETDETITFTLSPGSFFPPDGYAGIGVSGITSRTFTIADDDTPPTASIQQLVFIVQEGQSTNAIVRLSKPSALTAAFNVDRTGGNASAGDIQISPLSLTFLPGETQKVVTVTALDDTLVEGDEGFLLTMTSAANVILGSPRAFYIRDADGTDVTPENPTGLGANPGHRVRLRKAAAGISLSNINDAETLLGYALPDARVSFEVNDDGVATINYIDASTDTPPQGYFGNDRDFHSVPGSPTFAAGNIEQAAMEARGYLYVPTAGNWNFVVRSDDGFRLRIGSNNTVVAEQFIGRAPGDTLAVVDFPQPGYYRYQLTYFEYAGGAQVEFLAQPPFAVGGTNLVGSNEDGLLVFRDLEIPPTVQPVRDPFIPLATGHAVTFRKSSFNQTNIAAAVGLFALPTTDARVPAIASDNGVGVINYDDMSGVTGFFGNDRQIATPSLIASKGSFASGADDNFAMRAGGFLQVTNPGIWSFVVNSDDGFQLRLGTNFSVVSSFPDPRGLAATTNRVHLPVPGFYPYELLFFEWGGGALVEFFAFGPGQPTPLLVGEPAGAIRVYWTGSSELRLTITRNGNQSILRWPSGATGYTLERASIFAGAATVWTPVSGTPSLVSEFWQQTDNITFAPRYYRLRKP